MSTIVLDRNKFHIPKWVKSHSSFRRWARSDEFPETGRICYFNSEVWVDVSEEQFFSHNQVKNEFSFVLTGLVKADRSGRFVPDGMLLSNVSAGLSSQPDGVFVARKSLDTGRVRLVEGKREGYVELEGSPDMVLEVVSPSTVEKDTEILPDLYWQAGISEYWLVDVRGSQLVFEIFHHSSKGYTAVRKQGGWVRSAVFGKSFKLNRQRDERGDPEFVLAVR